MIDNILIFYNYIIFKSNYGKKLKFGGTSLGSIERIIQVASIIQKATLEKHQIIVVVSAMAGKTNELIEQSKSISKDFNK